MINSQCDNVTTQAAWSTDRMTIYPHDRVTTRNAPDWSTVIMRTHLTWEINNFSLWFYWQPGVVFDELCLYMSCFSNSLIGAQILPHYSIFHTWVIFHFLEPLFVHVYTDMCGHPEPSWLIKAWLLSGARCLCMASWIWIHIHEEESPEAPVSW